MRRKSSMMSFHLAWSHCESLTHILNIFYIYKNWLPSLVMKAYASLTHMIKIYYIYKNGYLVWWWRHTLLCRPRSWWQMRGCSQQFQEPSRPRSYFHLPVHAAEPLPRSYHLEYLQHRCILHTYVPMVFCICHGTHGYNLWYRKVSSR